MGAKSSIPLAHPEWPAELSAISVAANPSINSKSQPVLVVKVI